MNPVRWEITCPCGVDYEAMVVKGAYYISFEVGMCCPRCHRNICVGDEVTLVCDDEGIIKRSTFAIPERGAAVHVA